MGFILIKKAVTVCWILLFRVVLGCQPTAGARALTVSAGGVDQPKLISVSEAKK